MAMLLRIAALLACLAVENRALRTDSPRLAAVALALLALVVCMRGLLSLRARAWLIACAWIGIAVVLAQTRYAVPVLLLMPSAFLALACSLFARTLVRGRVPLVVRMVSLIDDLPCAQLPADVRAYATAVTRLWAGLLAALALLNFAMALVTVPGGVLDRFGIAPPWSLPPDIAAAVATWGIYLPMAGMLIGEFMVRQRRFPGRYAGPLDYIRKLARVPPAQWAGIFH